jgi:hypothetical protein
VITRVLVCYEGDDGRLLWAYDHTETVPHSGDPEQMALVAVGQLVEHIDKSRESIVAQAKVEVKGIPEDL